MKAPETIYKIENYTIYEYHYLAHVKSQDKNISSKYAIYCRFSGHDPIRVYLPHIDNSNSKLFSDLSHTKATFKLMIKSLDGYLTRQARYY